MNLEEAKAWCDRNEAEWDAESFKLRLKDGRFVRANNLETAASIASNLPDPIPPS